MAVNRKFAEGNLTQTAVRLVAQTASRTNNKALSGDPVRVGQIPGVALIDADADGLGTMQLDGVFEHLVGGIDSSGASAADANSAVKGGDAIYFDESKTPPLSKRSSGGILFGYAVGDHNVQLVASGATTTKTLVRTGR
jgi:predicted RecA/RadA family phage recombinase